MDVATFGRHYDIFVARKSFSIAVWELQVCVCCLDFALAGLPLAQESGNTYSCQHSRHQSQYILHGFQAHMCQKETKLGSCRQDFNSAVAT